MAKQMNICIALNRKYVRYAYVLLTSLFYNNPQYDVHVYALNDELNDEDNRALGGLCATHHSDWHDMKVNPQDFLKGLPLTEMWSKETLYRLSLIDVIPENVDRILYLDIDMIVAKDIRELYETEFGDKYFVATRDIPTVQPIPPEDPRYFLFRDHDFTDTYYINAGMMLWNLKELRGKYHLSSYMDVAAAHNFHIPVLDQDLLNLVHWGQMKYVDPFQYDCFTIITKRENDEEENGRRPKEASIIHYAGDKPWKAGLQNSANEIWWQYAKMTPFYEEMLEEYVLASCGKESLTSKYIQYVEENDKLKRAIEPLKTFYELHNKGLIS
ncbi:MAG: glycosyltransferase family 8 protein [Lachnospiraceae bacterium]